MHAVKLWIAAALVPVAAGCGSLGGDRTAASPLAADAQTVAPAKDTAPNQVQLCYQLDAGALGIPMALSSVAARQVSYREVTTAPWAGNAVGMLTAQYPHPAQRPGMALVSVVIRYRESSTTTGGALRQMWRELWTENSPSIGRSEMHEAWVLDIPRAELDGLVARLREGGFFDQPAAGQDAIELTATIDGHEVTKTWHQVPELDALMHRARLAGQLISLQGVALPPGAGTGAPPSLLAYRHYQQQEEEVLARHEGRSY